MAVGFFLNRSRIIPSEANKYFVDVLMLITTPCMILTSVTANEFNDEMQSATVQVLICGVGFFAVLFLLGLVLAKYVVRVKPPEDLGVYVLSFATVNNGFMGFPITNAIFGGSILYLMIIHNICLTVFMYSAGPFILSMNSGKAEFSLKRLLKTFCNPSTIVSFAAVAMLVAGLHLPDMLNETVTLIGDVTVPLSMLVVGMQLGDSNMGRIVRNKDLLVLSLVKMFAAPALIFLLLNWLPVADTVKAALTFAAAFPTAVVTSAIALLEKKNSLLSAEMIALTTLISVACIPLCALFLHSYYGV